MIMNIIGSETAARLQTSDAPASTVSPSANKRIGTAHNDRDMPLRSILRTAVIAPATVVAEDPSSVVPQVSTTSTDVLVDGVTVCEDVDLTTANIVYASQTFAARVSDMPGQISVIIGDKLNLIDDSNAYWWSVCNSKTAEKGYVPAEFVEFPCDRLARINRERNIKNAAPRTTDYTPEPDASKDTATPVEVPTETTTTIKKAEKNELVLGSPSSVSTSPLAKVLLAGDASPGPSPRPRSIISALESAAAASSSSSPTSSTSPFGTKVQTRSRPASLISPSQRPPQAKRKKSVEFDDGRNVTVAYSDDDLTDDEDDDDDNVTLNTDNKDNSAAVDGKEEQVDEAKQQVEEKVERPCAIRRLSIEQPGLLLGKNQTADKGKDVTNAITLRASVSDTGDSKSSSGWRFWRRSSNVAPSGTTTTDGAASADAASTPSTIASTDAKATLSPSTETDKAIATATPTVKKKSRYLRRANSTASATPRKLSTGSQNTNRPLKQSKSSIWNFSARFRSSDAAPPILDTTTTIKNATRPLSILSSKTVEADTKDTSTSTTTTAPALIVLKIFSGNHDFKATYKAIAVTPTTTVDQAVRMAVAKFRVNQLAYINGDMRRLSILSVGGDGGGTDGNHGNRRLSVTSITEDFSIGNRRWSISSTSGVGNMDGGIRRASISSTVPEEPSEKSSSSPQVIPRQRSNAIESSSSSSNSNDYYLSVVHGDSMEMRLAPHDQILDVLTRLQSKSIVPGVAPSSQRRTMKLMQHITDGGKVLSAVRIPHDSDIRFLLNLKPDGDEMDSAMTANTGGDSNAPNGASTKILLWRVYMVDVEGENNATGSVVFSCKTISLRPTMTGIEVLQRAILKFDLPEAKSRHMVMLRADVPTIDRLHDAVSAGKSSEVHAQLLAVLREAVSGDKLSSDEMAAHATRRFKSEGGGHVNVLLIRDFGM